jgi:flagellar protein FlaJ
MVARSVRIFMDSISIGGEAERVGRDAGFFALKIALLRIKRGTIATGFTWLAGIMHMVLVVLVLFIFQTIGQFTDLVQGILPSDASIPGAPSFGVFQPDSGQLGLLEFMVIGIALVLSVANATAVYATGGGHYYKLFFFLAVTMSITGAAMLVVPIVVSFMFKMMG